MGELTEFAWEGFAAADDVEPSYTHGSNAFMAWKVGKWLKDNQHARPLTVVPDQGYSVRVDGARIVIAAAAYGEPHFADARV